MGKPGYFNDDDEEDEKKKPAEAPPRTIPTRTRSSDVATTGPILRTAVRHLTARSCSMRSSSCWMGSPAFGSP